MVCWELIARCGQDFLSVTPFHFDLHFSCQCSYSISITQNFVTVCFMLVKRLVNR